MNRFLNVKAVVAAFNQETGEGPSRGLLRDYEPSDGTFSSTSDYCCCLPAADNIKFHIQSSELVQDADEKHIFQI